eukprot:1085899-Amphidinium_carterae.1
MQWSASAVARFSIAGMSFSQRAGDIIAEMVQRQCVAAAAHRFSVSFEDQDCLSTMQLLQEQGCVVQTGQDLTMSHWCLDAKIVPDLQVSVFAP